MKALFNNPTIRLSLIPSHVSLLGGGIPYTISSLCEATHASLLSLSLLQPSQVCFPPMTSYVQI